MTIVYAVLHFIFGLILGSFYNVVGLRVPQKQSIVHPPSHCPQCQQRLRAIDLIPVVSYLITLGKCRSCQSRISPLYPLGELLTGLLFVWTYVHFGFSLEWLIALLFVSLSIIITISDLAYMLIPNRVLLFFAPILLILRVLHHPDQPIWAYLVGALVGGGILLMIGLVSRGGMGMGDVKLFLIYGWVVGWQNILLGLMIASFIGTIVGGIMILFNKAKRKQAIPFGPYLAIGTWIAYLYGSQIIHWYLSIF